MQGNTITSTTHIGLINPYIYRSYRYDAETGLYYLNARYYSPVFGRFLNADGTLKSSDSLLAHNLYIYCNNNPVNSYDPNGRAPSLLVQLRNKILSNLGLLSAPIANSVYGPPAPAKTTTTAKTTTSITTKINNAVLANPGKLDPIGKPNSRVTKPNGDVRVYGPDGRALKDIDKSHPQRHPDLDNPHEHDWTWDENGEPHHGDAHNFADGVIEAGVAFGLGYVIYRGVRMLPSLIPALWWTIPANAVAP